MKYLGIDHGEANIGLAVADDETNLAVPYDTLLETDLERQLDAVSQIVLDEDIGTVIVGFPLTMEGKAGHQADITLNFITELEGRLAVPVKREDERLSSKLASQVAKELQGQTGDEHALAAASILQTYLDRKLRA